MFCNSGGSAYNALLLLAVRICCSCSMEYLLSMSLCTFGLVCDVAVCLMAVVAFWASACVWFCWHDPCAHAIEIAASMDTIDCTDMSCLFIGPPISPPYQV